MNEFDVYSIYNSMRLHFTSKGYDAVKYRFKSKVTPQSFFKRKDKYFFSKLGRRFNTVDDLVHFFAINFVNDRKWVGEMFNDEEAILITQKRLDSLSYTFENELSILENENDSFDYWLATKDDTYPPIINKLLSEEISIETAVILNKVTRFAERTDKIIGDTIIWPETYLKISKYGPFVIIDTEKMKKIILKVFTN